VSTSIDSHPAGSIGPPSPPGVLASAADVLRAGPRDIASLLSGGVARTASAVPPPVVRLLTRAETLLDQMPQLTDELAVVIAEIHAKRSTIQAVQQELAVLDQQLEVLEQSLAPLESSLKRWVQLRRRWRRVVTGAG